MNMRKQEVATAIRGAIILAKLSVVPIRRGYWGNKIGAPHTVPSKVSNGGSTHMSLLVIDELSSYKREDLVYIDRTESECILMETSVVEVNSWTFSL